MALDPNHNQLPCGVSLETLIAQVTDQLPAPDPAHHAHCTYCQTAQSAFHHSWSDMQTLAHAPVPIPSGLTTRIMTRIRELAARAAHSIILATPRGHTQISHHVIAQIGRRVAQATPGVLIASAQPEPDQPGDPTRINLAVRLITTYGPALPTIADAVRSAVYRRVTTLTAAKVKRIDIAFTDIADPDAGDQEQVQRRDQSPRQ